MNEDGFRISLRGLFRAVQLVITQPQVEPDLVQVRGA